MRRRAIILSHTTANPTFQKSFMGCMGGVSKKETINKLRPNMAGLNFLWNRKPEIAAFKIGEGRKSRPVGDMFPGYPWSWYSR